MQLRCMSHLNTINECRMPLGWIVFINKIENLILVSLNKTLHRHFREVLTSSGNLGFGKKKKNKIK